MLWRDPKLINNFRMFNEVAMAARPQADGADHPHTNRRPRCGHYGQTSCWWGRPAAHEQSSLRWPWRSDLLPMRPTSLTRALDNVVAIAVTSPSEGQATRARHTCSGHWQLWRRDAYGALQTVLNLTRNYFSIEMKVWLNIWKICGNLKVMTCNGSFLMKCLLL